MAVSIIMSPPPCPPPGPRQSHNVPHRTLRSLTGPRFSIGEAAGACFSKSSGTIRVSVIRALADSPPAAINNARITASN